MLWCPGVHWSFPSYPHHHSHHPPPTLLTILQIWRAHWGVYWDPIRLGSMLPCPFLVMLWPFFTLAHFGLNWSTCCLSPLPVLLTIGFSGLSAFDWCLYHSIWLSFDWDIAILMTLCSLFFIFTMPLHFSLTPSVLWPFLYLFGCKVCMTRFSVSFLSTFTRTSHVVLELLHSCTRSCSFVEQRRLGTPSLSIWYKFRWFDAFLVQCIP